MAAVHVKCATQTIIGYPIVNIRLLFYGLALLNLLVTANYMLKLNMSIEEDPIIRQYDWIKFNLLTIWFNALFLIYIPFCIYCDWREKKGDVTPQMDQLRKIRDVSMEGLLFPITIYCDIVFWTLYTSFPEIIGPARMLEIVPYWGQHSFHTVSIVFVILDLILTPRHRPKSDKTNLTVLYGFSFIYVVHVYVNYKFGYMIYGFLRTASRTICLLTVVCSYLIVTFLYYVQWYIIGYFWDHKSVKLRTEGVSMKLD